MSKTEVGNRICMLRKAKSWSQERASKELEMPRSTYVNYEMGVCEPNLTVLLKLATVYGISVDWLIGTDSIKKDSPPENRWKAFEETLEALSDKEINEVYSYIKFLIWKKKQGKEEQG